MMTEFIYELKIPKERIAVLIGKEGDIKKEIESATKTSLNVDSKEGDVFIKGEDGLGMYTAREVVQAIGRGFNPNTAMLLLKNDYVFDTLSMNDFIGKSKDTMIRLKGRVIGKEGKCRTTIEELTECYVSVYGKTIGIIGAADHVPMARQAIESLLRRSPHANVYKWLEKKRREQKKSRPPGS